ncbi:YdeI/OmpD-associated family protein [Devosia aquimaris]|uniref:YdeI/OmpD-associated family protein n=1 Tax=Devosia aquimaris TaxID=2866214 RepID=UPI001CD049B5|nr:YdeI/OmpD-associated family protein [Devosia sp. CJK-A8-3]
MSPVLRPLRKREPMPEFVSAALEERGLRAAYDARPPYQRNDYLLWIGKVKGEQTRLRHLAQMLDELEAGDVYMGMRWSPRQRARNAVSNNDPSR